MANELWVSLSSLGFWWSNCWTWYIKWRVIQRQHANNAVTERQLDSEYGWILQTVHSRTGPYSNQGCWVHPQLRNCLSLADEFTLCLSVHLPPVQSPVSIGQLPYFSNRKQFDQMFQSFYLSNLACSNDMVWKQNSYLFIVTALANTGLHLLLWNVSHISYSLFYVLAPIRDYMKTS